MARSQAELIGEAREKKRDAARREKLHAKWLAAQDTADMEAVVAAMKSGWRRPGRNGGLDGDLVWHLLRSMKLITLSLLVRPSCHVESCGAQVPLPTSTD